MAERQIREIVVKLDTRGDPTFKGLAKSLKEVNGAVKSTADSFKFLNRAFLTIQGLSFAGLGVGNLITAADSMQKLTDRLTLSEGSFEGARRAIGSLNEVANENKVSIEDTAGVYTRLNNVLRDTGITSNSLLGFTDLLQKSFRLSGSTAGEASSSIIQLSQGLASGQVRGQELRSVLEGNALAGELLARQLKITRGELLKYSEKNDGIKASVFFEAFANGADQITEASNKLRPTIGEALTTAFNDLKVQLGDVNREFQLTEKVVSGIEFIAGNVKDLAIGLAAAGVAYKVYASGVTAATIANSAFIVSAKAAIATALAPIAVAIGAISVPVAAAVAGIAALAGVFGLVYSESPQMQSFFGDLGSKLKSYNEQVYQSSKNTGFMGQKFKELPEALTQVQRPLELIGSELPSIVKEFNQIVEGKADYKINDYVLAFRGFSKTIVDSQKDIFNYKTAMVELNKQFSEKKVSVSQYNAEIKKIEIKKLDADFKAGEINLATYNKRLNEIKFGKIREQALVFQQALAALNKQYESGGISLTNYARAFDELKEDKGENKLAQGKQNILDMNKALAESKIKEFTRSFAEGNITLNQFNAGVREAKIKELNFQFQAGLIDIHAYNKALTETSEKFQPGAALSTGLNDFINSAGTISQGVSTVVTNTFGSLENALVEFTKNGKFAFKDFANAVIEDLNRVIIRSLIIRPLAQGILGAIPGGGASSGNPADASFIGPPAPTQAQGGVWEAGMQKFAKGGVVHRPTTFNHASGRGLMGEAGPEAIIPLRRNKSGELGVQAAAANTTVNIINQSGAEVSQKETTDSQGNKAIEVLIHSTVKQGMAQGYYDKQFSNQYGLRRRGQ